MSAAENNETTDSVAEILAALVNGDRWLCAGAGAAYLGQMPKKFDVMELARVIGHRNLSSLLLYYNASADELADRL